MEICHLKTENTLLVTVQKLNVMLHMSVQYMMIYSLFSKANETIENFNILDSFNKICSLLSNVDIVRMNTKTLCDILARRPTLIYT